MARALATGTLLDAPAAGLPGREQVLADLSALGVAVGAALGLGLTPALGVVPLGLVPLRLDGVSPGSRMAAPSRVASTARREPFVARSRVRESKRRGSMTVPPMFRPVRLLAAVSGPGPSAALGTLNSSLIPNNASKVSRRGRCRLAAMALPTCSVSRMNRSDDSGPTIMRLPQGQHAGDESKAK